MKQLVLGGVKSGKSKFAEQSAEALLRSEGYDAITLVATAQALDDEMHERIQRHKDDRPELWSVIEEPLRLSRVLSNHGHSNNVLVVDCLTLWLTNLLMLDDQKALDAELDAFLLAVEAFKGHLILVSNETNMGVMPLGELSRRYCDTIGTLHKKLALITDKVDLIVAGLPLPLKPQKRCGCGGEPVGD